MSKSIWQAIKAARDEKDFSRLAQEIPFMEFMRISMDLDDETVVATMDFHESLIGNYTIQALHGGSVGGLLETVAAFQVILGTDCEELPKIVSVTVEYLRSGKAIPTHARADITRHGRRVAVARAYAWQDDPTRPIAAANVHFLVGP